MTGKTPLKGLRPPKIMELTNDRERILMIGGAGAGKSYGFYSIAKAAAVSGSDAKFYIVDTDESVGRMISDPAFNPLIRTDIDTIETLNDALVNIEFTSATSWDELRGAVERYQKKMRAHDWLMIDMLSPTWQMVQEWFTYKFFNRDLAEFFSQARAKVKADSKVMNPFEGAKDWTVIKAQYAELQNMILRCPGHIYCTSEVKAFGANDEKDAQARAQFGPHGVMPVGEKRTPHVFSTILVVENDVYGTRRMKTVKDRSRRLLEGEQIMDMAADYLVGVGGWMIGKTPAEALAEAMAAKAAAKKVSADAA